MLPPTHSSPSTSGTPWPPLGRVEPLIKRAGAPAGKLEAANSRSSAVTPALPVAASRPPAPLEFAHPTPGSPALEHGHAVPVPSPKQYEWNGVTGIALPLIACPL